MESLNFGLFGNIKVLFPAVTTLFVNENLKYYKIDAVKRV